jgi:hypothetical protein
MACLRAAAGALRKLPWTPRPAGLHVAAVWPGGPAAPLQPSGSSPTPNHFSPEQTATVAHVLRKGGGEKVYSTTRDTIVFDAVKVSVSVWFVWFPVGLAHTSSRC